MPVGIDEYTKLLDHFNGPDAGQNFQDYSGQNHTITANGDAQHFSHPLLDGRGALYFDGSGDYLHIPDSDDFNFGSNAFTIDFWFKDDGSSANYPSFIATQGGWANGFAIRYNNVGQAQKVSVHWQPEGDPILTSTNTFATGTWHHVAVVRSGSNLYLFVDGTLEDSDSSISTDLDLAYGGSVRLGWATWDGGNGYYKGYITEMRISDIARWTSGFTPETSQYAEDANTLLLIHTDEPDLTVAAKDESDSGHFVTTVGDVYSDKTHPLNDGKGILVFDGTGDYFTTPDSADWELGSGDFTLDFLVYPISGASDPYILTTRSGSGNTTIGIFIGHTSSKWRVVVFSGSDDYGSYDAENVTFDAWSHIALVRNGSTVTAYLNGVAMGTGSASSDIGSSSVNDPNSLLGIGRDAYYSSRVFKGYLTEIRISKGVARWTSAFTPQSTQYSSDSYTKLLIHANDVEGDTTPEDSSGSSHTITGSGDAYVKVTKPLVDNQWEMIFSGSNDYLSIRNFPDFDFGSDDLTVDFWFYPTVEGRFALFAGSTDYWFGFDYHYQGTRNINLWVSGNGSSWNLINADPGGNGIGSTSLTLNTWNHFAAVRNGNNWMTFINGVKDIDITVSGSIVTKDEAKKIGEWGNGTMDLTGRITEFRVSRGIARWTSGFTPETSKYTADSYTKLLIHGGGVIDSSSSNRALRPYGNVKVRTCGRFGRGSCIFDGTTDYLSIADHDDWNFGTGDFTVEGWLLLDAQAATDMFISSITSNQLYIQPFKAGNRWDVMLGGSSTKFSDSDIKIGEWMHMAMIRTSGTVKFFVDGVQKGSNWSNSNSVDMNGVYYGRRWDGNYLAGRIDEPRISKGVARWTSNFTPPNSEYTKEWTSDGPITYAIGDVFIGSDGDILYGYDGKIKSDGPILYDYHSKLSKDSDILYEILKELSKDGQVVYDYLSNLVKDAEVVYDYYQQYPHADGGILYKYINEYLKDGQVLYDYVKSVVKDGSLLYRYSGVPIKDAQVLYRILNDIKKDGGILYDIINRFEIDGNIAYAYKGTLIKDGSIVYDTVLDVAKNGAFAYQLIQLLQVDGPIFYMYTGPLYKDGNLLYQYNQSAVKDGSFVYDMIEEWMDWIKVIQHPASQDSVIATWDYTSKPAGYAGQVLFDVYRNGALYAENIKEEDDFRRVIGGMARGGKYIIDVIAKPFTWSTRTFDYSQVGDKAFLTWQGSNSGDVVKYRIYWDQGQGGTPDVLLDDVLVNVD